MVVIVIVDWKKGKIINNNCPQLPLYSLNSAIDGGNESFVAIVVC